MPHLDVVQPGIPAKDDCPILTRIKAFVVYEGHCATLEHIFRDRQGAEIDLDAEGHVSESESAVAEDVILRVHEMVGCAVNPTQVHEIEADFVAGTTGTVRATLTDAIVSRAGIYKLNWAYREAGRITLINEGLLSVERSLFGGLASPKHVTGPPTINELRMHIMDSSPGENLLLDELEFGDEQISMALVRPVEHFNEINPPLRRFFTTQDFPWRKHWLDAATGYLMQFAAHNYRRNRLDVRAGGITIDDQNKETEYLRAAKLLLDEWKEFAKLKKYELNQKECMGIIGSAYDW